MSAFKNQPGFAQTDEGIALQLRIVTGDFYMARVAMRELLERREDFFKSNASLKVSTNLALRIYRDEIPTQVGRDALAQWNYAQDPSVSLEEFRLRLNLILDVVGPNSVVRARIITRANNEAPQRLRLAFMLWLAIWQINDARTPLYMQQHALYDEELLADARALARAITATEYYRP